MKKKRSSPIGERVPRMRATGKASDAAAVDVAAPLAEAAWERGAVTLRLTVERKQKLRALFNDGDEKLSPTGALDLAIERAVVGGILEPDDNGNGYPPERELSPLVDELRCATQVFANASQDWANIRAQLSRVTADCAELRSAISSAAMLCDGVPVRALNAPVPLKSWLDREADPGRAWVLAKARWTAKKSAGPASNAVTWEFEVQLVDDPGASNLPEPSPASVVVGPAASHALLSQIELSEMLIFVCSRSGKGWTIAARAIHGGAKLGQVLATFNLN